MKVSKSFLLVSAYSKNQMAEPRLPEFAFVGRSNVGKSSLINMLVGQRLARTSNTPGKTRLMHFYLVNDRFVLVDLPGYGYAKVSKEDRNYWEERLLNYLIERPNLACALQLIDARHGPQANDLEMARFMWENQIRRGCALTKVDKISKNVLQKTVQACASGLRLDPTEIVPVSAEKGQGRDELWRYLLSKGDRALG